MNQREHSDEKQETMETLPQHTATISAAPAPETTAVKAAAGILTKLSQQ